MKSLSFKASLLVSTSGLLDLKLVVLLSRKLRIRLKAITVFGAQIYIVLIAESILANTAIS
jgi:hypothetical protein